MKLRIGAIIAALGLGAAITFSTLSLDPSGSIGYTLCTGTSTNCSGESVVATVANNSSTNLPAQWTLTISSTNCTPDQGNLTSQTVSGTGGSVTWGPLPVATNIVNNGYTASSQPCEYTVTETAVTGWTAAYSPSQTVAMSTSSTNWKGNPPYPPLPVTVTNSRTRQPSTLKLTSPAAVSITQGAGTIVSAKATKGSDTAISGAHVVLQRLAGATWQSVLTRTSSTGGNVSASVKPTANTRYRWSLAASTTYTAATSATETVTVKKPAVTTKIWIAGASKINGVYQLNAGIRYWLEAQTTSKTAPIFIFAAPAGAKIGPGSTPMIKSGTDLWKLQISLGQSRYKVWNMGVRIGSTTYVITVNVS